MKSSDPIVRLSEIRAQIVALKHEAHAVIDSLKADFESAEPAALPPPKRRGRKPKSTPSAPSTSSVGRKSGKRGRKPAVPLNIPALAPVGASPAAATPAAAGVPVVLVDPPAPSPVA